MAKVDPDTYDEMEFVRYEIDRICKLLDLEKLEIIELKKVKSLSPVPKLSRDGKEIVKRAVSSGHARSLREKME